MEPIDVEMDENCDTSNLQPESGIEGEKNCDFSNRFVMIKISKKEKTLADLHLKNHEIIVKSEFQVERTNTEPMSDDEIDENCDTSNIIKTSDHEEEDVSEYEKLRLKNIAERQAKFNELKIKDKVLDLSKSNKIKKRKVTKEKFAAVKRPILARKFKGRRIKIKKSEHDAERGSFFKCDHCRRTCTTQAGLSSHIRHSHKEVQHIQRKHEVLSSYDCEQCPKKYKWKRDLESHIKTKHEGLSFDCEHCNKSFGTSYDLRMHVSWKHPVTQSFECHLCPKICGSQTGLDAHVTTHYLSESINKMLECDHCSFTAYSSSVLKHHRDVIHLKNVKYSCDKCDYFAYCQSHLKTHKFKCHGDQNQEGKCFHL